MEITFFNWRLSLERVFYEEDTLASMYDEAASRWSRSIDWMGYLEAYSALFSRLCADGTLATMQNGAAILDAGIGTGELTAALTQHQPQAHWHGIDISDEMLRAAEKNLGVVGEFKQANLADLPYEDDTFDLVISAHALEHMPDPEVGISELMRVLKPGQPFVIVATRLCPITTFLSLRWNFKPMPTNFVLESLATAGAMQPHVQSLMPRRSMAYMSLVYTGVKNSTM